MNRDAQLGPGFAQARQASGVVVHRQLAHCCNLHGAVGPVPSKVIFFSEFVETDVSLSS